MSQAEINLYEEKYQKYTTFNCNENLFQLCMERYRIVLDRLKNNISPRTQIEILTTLIQFLNMFEDLEF